MDAQVLADWESCDKTDTLFVVICSVICWGIIPAVGLGYSGYSTRHNSLASFFPALLAVICVSLQWYILGYSLAYGEGNGFIGDLEHAFHRGVLAQPVGTIPAILFSEFQLIFAATVAAIAVGGACERGRLLPLIPFLFVSRFTGPNLNPATFCLHLSLTGTVDSSGPLLYTAHWRIWYGLNLDTSTKWESSISPVVPLFTSVVVPLRLLSQFTSHTLYFVRVNPISGRHRI